MKKKNIKKNINGRETQDRPINQNETKVKEKRKQGIKAFPGESLRLVGTANAAKERHVVVYVQEQELENKVKGGTTHRRTTYD